MPPRRSATPPAATRTEPRFRILLGEAIAMGPGKADLLEAIDRTGSISAAARTMDMSYRRAWLLVDTMNTSFTQPLVAAKPGGSRGGGAQVTAFGRAVLDAYRRIEEAAAAAVAEEIAQFRTLLRS